MNLALVLPTTGEYDTRSRLAARAAASRGHRVILFARAPSGAEEAGRLAAGDARLAVEGIRVLRAAPARGLAVAGRAGRGLRFLALGLAYRAVAQKAGLTPDLWHASALPGLVAALVLRAGSAARLVYDARDVFVESRGLARAAAPLRGAVMTFERALARRADAVMTVNEAAADRLWALLRLQRRPSVVVNGRDPLAALPDPLASPLRAAVDRALGPAPGAPLLLTHGGLYRERGIEEAIDLAGALPEVRLAVLGYGPLGPELRTRADLSPAAARVAFLPPVPPEDLLAWVAGADLSLCLIRPTTPNHLLATPNKLFEALAAGVPVLATDLPGLRSVLGDSAAGVLIGAGAGAGALAGVVKGLLGEPAQQRRARREAAQALARRWGWSAQVDALLSTWALATGMVW